MDSQFFDEFLTFLEALVTATGSLLEVGVLNFHAEDRKTGKLCSICKSLRHLIRNNTWEPTHQSGHTLHLLITRAGESVAGRFCVRDPVLSDHFAIVWRDG